MSVTAHASPLGASDHWPPSAEDAAREAAWWAAYALDRSRGGDGRTYHVGFVSHLEAARTQFTAALKLATPANDQRVIPEAEWASP